MRTVWRAALSLWPPRFSKLKHPHIGLLPRGRRRSLLRLVQASTYRHIQPGPAHTEPRAATRLAPVKMQQHGTCTPCKDTATTKRSTPASKVSRTSSNTRSTLCCRPAPRSLLRLHGREEQHLLDVRGVCRARGGAGGAGHCACLRGHAPVHRAHQQQWQPRKRPLPAHCQAPCQPTAPPPPTAAHSPVPGVVNGTCTHVRCFHNLFTAHP